MEISEIKQQVSLASVLQHYGLQPKNNMLQCPFHQDQTASLQVHLEKNFYKCHACGKAGDVIQFVQDFEKLSKHEAILTCKGLVGEIPLPKRQIMSNEISLPKKAETDSTERIAFLSKMFSSFKNGLLSSKPAQGYCEIRLFHYGNTSKALLPPQLLIITTFRKVYKTNKP